MLSENLQRRVLYAKVLFNRGNELMGSTIFGNDGLILLCLHDAVEMFLRTIAEFYDANLSPSENFDKIILKIDEAPKNINKVLVPRRIALIQLNKARVNFKHYGLLPISDDVKKLCGDIEQFFREASSKLLEIDFDSVSLASLVRHQRAQNMLHAAEVALQNSAYHDAIEFAAKAFVFHWRFIEHYSYHRRLHSSRNLGDDTLERLIKNLETELEQHQQQLNLLSFGISLADYRRFYLKTPGVILTGANTAVVQYGNNSKGSPSPDDAAFCIEFALRSCLAMQENLIQDRKPLLPTAEEVEVFHEAPVIVYPKEEPLEIIRTVKVGERVMRVKTKPYYEGYFEILQDNEIAYIPEAALLQ